MFSNIICHINSQNCDEPNSITTLIIRVQTQLLRVKSETTLEMLLVSNASKPTGIPFLKMTSHKSQIMLPFSGFDYQPKFNYIKA